MDWYRPPHEFGRATEQGGMRRAQVEMGRRAISSHDLPGGVHIFLTFLSNELRFGSTVIMLGHRALLQVYDTEGTASSNSGVLVRLWVGGRG